MNVTVNINGETVKGTLAALANKVGQVRPDTRETAVYTEEYGFVIVDLDDVEIDADEE